MGAYQTSYAGGFDIGDAFLAKFNTSGKLLWSTYFGGAGIDEGWGISTDLSGNVFITGPTGSINDIATQGAYQTSLAGVNNAFLAKFSALGSLIWATYYGGNISDAGQGAITDTFGNIYITGLTQSTTGIATAGAYQTSFSGGFSNGDAFLAKFSNSGRRLWSTYFGGNDDDEGNSICLDAIGNIYIIGRTFSKSRIATSGAYQTSNASITREGNAFLAKFNLQFLNDAGVSGFTSPVDSVCPGKQLVSVVLNNYGTNTLGSVTINYRVNGQLQKPYYWIGTLLPDSSQNIIIGDYDFNPGIETIVAWTASPNGQKDSIPENDTMRTVYKVSSPDAHWSMSSLSSWTKLFIVNQASYPSADYIWDFGDGASDVGNSVVHKYSKNGQYVVGLTTCSIRYDSSILIIGNFDLSIFPNPFATQTNIKYFLPNSAHIKISIADMLGRNIATLVDNTIDSGVYVTSYNASMVKARPGMYLVLFMIENKLIARKIVQLESEFY